MARRPLLPPALLVALCALSTASAQTPLITKSAAQPVLSVQAPELDVQGTAFYLDRGKWLAIDPEAHRSARIALPTPEAAGVYDLRLHTVGEHDGRARFTLWIDGEALKPWAPPFSEVTFETGPAFTQTWEGVRLATGSTVEVQAEIASTDNREFSRARWARLDYLPSQQRDGDGSVTVSGNPRLWQPVTLSLAGPYAHEADTDPNPFLDLRLNATFTHAESGTTLAIPGFFAADGLAAHTSADAGNVWQVRFAPPETGTWNYTLSFAEGEQIAIRDAAGSPLQPFDGQSGSFEVAPAPADAEGFYTRGHLRYTGERYLRFAGTGERFIKSGPDSPETFLGTADFDGTVQRKDHVPLKQWKAHVRDWRPGDPLWQGTKGKGILGALNYLAEAGLNSVSMLTYNAGGDGDNVWPFRERDKKTHYDVSKLAQWDLVFSHAQARGIHLHFKLQETEIDDERHYPERIPDTVPEALDGGKLGMTRKLYLRELVARFGHHLALTWNLGEENTQTTEELLDMANHLRALDAYGHHVVVHTYPEDQYKVYEPLLGNEALTGPSLQNHWSESHQRTLHWIEASAEAGRQWVVSHDEQGTAMFAALPDTGYAGFSGLQDDGDAPYHRHPPRSYTQHDLRKYTLWGNLMAGGAGVEWYFGYLLPENDLNAQDYSSRQQLWHYCRIALDFFGNPALPLEGMENRDELVGNPEHDNGPWCLAAVGEAYLVYLPEGGSVDLDLSNEEGGTFTVNWFNPEHGGSMVAGESVSGGGSITLGPAPERSQEDWAILLQRKE